MGYSWLRGQSAGPRVLLMAHMDEVGFLVRHIDDEGLVYFHDVHNHPGVQNFEAVAQAYWPATPPRIDRSALRGSYTR